MAKKQQPKLSYGPNMALIQGEAAVAASENFNVMGAAFASGAQSMFDIMDKAKQEEDDKMEKYAKEYPGADQVHLLADPVNKAKITNYLREQRKEYSRLSAEYERTKNPDLLDQIDGIKSAAMNLNSQIEAYNADKSQYREDYDNGFLAEGNANPNSNFYTDIFTNNSEMNVDISGNLTFMKDNESVNYKDYAGNYNLKPEESINFVSNLFSQGVSYGQQGGDPALYKDNAKTSLLNHFNSRKVGVEQLHGMLTTDFSQDGSPLSFERQWLNGELDDKYYPDGKKEMLKAKNSNYLFDKNNKKQVVKMMSEYWTDVVDDGVVGGKKAYDTKQNEALNREINLQQSKPLQDYIQESRTNISDVNKLIKTGITLQGLQSLIIDPKLSRQITEITEGENKGKFQILDSQNQATYIDPTKAIEARNILFNLVGARAADRQTMQNFYIGQQRIVKEGKNKGKTEVFTINGWTLK
tara:strand:- start:8971 stop:10377 length:1407 start_codon:yes stop_codon:yes gene_type:complete